MVNFIETGSEALYVAVTPCDHLEITTLGQPIRVLIEYLEYVLVTTYKVDEDRYPSQDLDPINRRSSGTRSALRLQFTLIVPGP